MRSRVSGKHLLEHDVGEALALNDGQVQMLPWQGESWSPTLGTKMPSIDFDKNGPNPVRPFHKDRRRGPSVSRKVSQLLPLHAVSSCAADS